MKGRRMKSKIMLVLFLAITFLSASCTTLKVVFPKALQTSSQDFSTADGHITIKVTFNRAVNQSTVVVGKTFVLVTEKDPNSSGSLAWSVDGKTVTFRTTKTKNDLLIFDPDGRFTLKLIGSDTGNGAIKDLGGKHLDGDSNNADGGDYSTSFILIG